MSKNLQNLAPQLRSLIKENGRIYKVRKGQVFQASDHREALTVIEEGYIKRYSITNAGTQSIQSIYGPEYVFPLTWIYKVILNQNIYTGRETFYYETMVASTLYTIDQVALEKILEENPTIYKDLFEIAGRRLHSNIHNLENLSLENIHKRIAHQIAFMAEMYGHKTAKGIELCFKLRQQDLASILDVTRESVSVNMKLLRKKGYIKGISTITVPDLEKLKDFAYS